MTGEKLIKYFIITVTWKKWHRIQIMWMTIYVKNECYTFHLANQCPLAASEVPLAGTLILSPGPLTPPVPISTVIVHDSFTTVLHRNTLWTLSPLIAGIQKLLVSFPGLKTPFSLTSQNPCVHSYSSALCYFLQFMFSTCFQVNHTSLTGHVTPWFTVDSQAIAITLFCK